MAQPVAGWSGVTLYVEAGDPATVLDRVETLEGKTVVPPAEIVVGLSRGAVQ